MLVDRESGEIFLYAPIGASFWDDGISAEGFIQALDSLDGRRAKLRINSPGGSVDEGIAIYNAAKRYSGGVDTYVDSLAASIASVIALAGENRYTAKGGRWMIHRALTLAVGNATDMRKVADVLEKHDQSIIEVYGGAIRGKTNAEIEAMMDAETWFTTVEAMDVGLSTAMDPTEAREPLVANWFCNAPKALYEQPHKAVIAPKFRAYKTASIR